MHDTSALHLTLIGAELQRDNKKTTPEESLLYPDVSRIWPIRKELNDNEG